MEEINNRQRKAVEICECNAEWRGVLGGNDWEECQCYLLGEKDETEEKEARNPQCL
ncbi:MAG: hypothetical protein KJ804_07490 [Proteobacteria bacterium]|nr:hypothetical protein [Pseudomonadota bacterium]MBU1058143.1 hypothetical protein [Pseudomonadota bacterium]